MDKTENVSRGIRKSPQQRKKKADMGSRLDVARAVLEGRERVRESMAGKIVEMVRWQETENRA